MSEFRSSSPPDFSLVLGGPLFQLLVRCRLSTPALELLRRRIIIITLFAWLPLFLLSLFEGRAIGSQGMPFLYDFEMNARFLLALPLLIVAELTVHRRVRLAVGQFVDRDIITPELLPKFDQIIASAMRIRNSVVIETILFLLIFVGGRYLWVSAGGLPHIGAGAGSWYATTTDGLTHTSLAGYWYMFVSRPLFQFILLRWYFRLLIWARFLWQTSRMELNLIPIHPDHAAGLGFLGVSCAAFIPLLLAHGVLLSGLLANRIYFAGQKLTDFRMEILAALAILLLFVLGPLSAFSPRLMRTRRVGLREYGALASRYVREFDRKWLRSGAKPDDQLIGSSDIQSLADLANSYQIIRQIQPLPFGRDTIILLTFAILLPILPLVLTLVPLEQLIAHLFSAIF